VAASHELYVPPAPPHYIKDIKLAEPLTAPVLAEQPVVADIPVPVPEPAPAPVYVPPATTCQTYFSGDYYLDNIIRYESGGNSCATNYLGCFGLLQACPGEPLRAACGGSPGCQIAWFQQYKTGGRSWAQVWQHELDFGWW
jgi:hypothetical protein